MVGVKSLQKALNILDLFITEKSELGVSDVSLKLGMNKSTVSRLMASMELAGYLTKTPCGRKYRLDKKVAQLANVFFSALDFKAVIMPYLEHLNEKTKEMTVVHVIQGDSRRSLAWIDSKQPVRRVMDPNDTSAPLHAGSPGKLLLAYLSDERINEIISRTGLPRYTPNTITSKVELFKEIKKIREEGIAISKGEHIELLSTVAAPIRNYIGQVIGALSISWVSRNNDSDIERKYSDLVKKDAGEISREMGFQG